MNFNDYTYHLCDRFVLMFVASVGLIGTSYILISGNNPPKKIKVESFSIGMSQQSSAVATKKYMAISTDLPALEKELASEDNFKEEEMEGEERSQLLQVSYTSTSPLE